MRKTDLLRLILDELATLRSDIMSGLTDLQAALTAESTELSDLGGLITAFLQAIEADLANDDSDAAVEAAAQQVQSFTAQLQGFAAQIQAAEPPAASAPTTTTAPTASTTTAPGLS